MATVSEKMTALADEIRELSGTTAPKSIDTMTSDIDAANTEITEQTVLLNQIAVALEGKAGGENIADEINMYTAKIEELETAIGTLEGELEGKIGGGEDVTIETDVYTAKIDELKNSITTLEKILEWRARNSSAGNYQISVGTAIADGVAIYVEDLPFTPKYVAIFICESDDGPRAGLLACAEFGTFDGVEYSSQTEPYGGPGGMGSSTEPSEMELTENGFIIFPRAGQAVAYRYIAIG